MANKAKPIQKQNLKFTAEQLAVIGDWQKEINGESNNLSRQQVLMMLGAEAMRVRRESK